MSFADRLARAVHEKDSTLVVGLDPDPKRMPRELTSSLQPDARDEHPEQPGGYYIIDAESVEEAVEWAKKGRWLIGSNEVRQIITLPG